MIRILGKYTGVADPALYDDMVMPYLSPDGRINKDSLARDLNYYVQAGQVQTPPDLSKIVTDRWVAEALAALEGKR